MPYTIADKQKDYFTIQNCHAFW